MSFDWLEYLDLARELAGQTTAASTQEAKWRSAISRAYYAAFCKARNCLRDKQGLSIPRTGQAHRIVWRQFKNSPDKSRKRIGENLRRLLNDRRQTDYEDVVSNLPVLTHKAVTRASEVVSVLGKL
ncbi:MAG TPA: HEPN domain-containing protein [Blastocatellia bacterium]|nr:HEPN domain-containing protein [Blastocatellia bacterium]